jgi:hypothetical protein
MSIITIKIEAAEGRPFRTGTQHSRAYVGGELGQRYKIAVTNNSWKRVAVVVTVDGKNVLDGKPGDPDGQAMIISGNSAYAFDGWRTSMSEVAAFRLVDVADAYATKTGDSSNVGVVGCAVFEERGMLRRDPVPIAAPASFGGTIGGTMRGRAGGMGLGAPVTRSAGTGFGEQLESRVSTTTFDRATKDPAEIHVVYYDTVSNLIARGILPADDGPNPFPAKTPAPTFCSRPE